MPKPDIHVMTEEEWEAYEAQVAEAWEIDHEANSLILALMQGSATWDDVAEFFARNTGENPYASPSFDAVALQAALTQPR